VVAVGARHVLSPPGSWPIAVPDEIEERTLEPVGQHPIAPPKLFQECARGNLDSPKQCFSSNILRSMTKAPAAQNSP
jgi:hypothetical protein